MNPKLEVTLHRADQDAQLNNGKIVELFWLYGIHPDCDVSVDLQLPLPVRGRLVCKPGSDDVHHICDEWVDPRYEVELLSEFQDLVIDGVRLKDFNGWVYGPSYNADTGECQPSSDWKEILEVQKGVVLCLT